MSTDLLERRKTQARVWFESLRDEICAAFEGVEAGLLTAAPFAARYGRWYGRHPREHAPPMESAPADVTRARGPKGHSGSSHAGEAASARTT